MIECQANVLSWNYTMQGDGIDAGLRFNWAGESGRFELNDQLYTIKKSGLITPTWELIKDDKHCAEASKISILRRGFEIKLQSGAMELSAKSAFGRTMLLSGMGCQACIKPAHAFTRRVQISGSYPDPETIVFAFWLCALIWRRNANHAAACP